MDFAPVIFDLDGTLVDSGSDIANAVNHVIAGLGLEKIPERELFGQIGDGVRRLFREIMGVTERDEVNPQIEAFRAYYLEHYLDNTVAYPGITELLDDLDPARVAIVTNKPGYFARMVTDGVGLTSRVGVVIGGDETDLIKPDPEPLIEACKQLGTAPQGGIMIGDYHNDIEAGKAAGMSTCGVLWGFVGPEAVTAAGPDHLCRNAEELRTLLLG